jgi:hypothetical protein
MKWIYRLFTLLILGVALGLPFLIDNKQGEPMLKLPESKDLVPQNLVPTAVITVYKWKDVDGVWHYGDTPPPTGGSSVQMIEVNPNTNLIAGLPAEPETRTEGEPAAEAPQMTDPNTDLLNLDRLKNVMSDAKAARALMEQRNEQLKQISGDP